MLDYRTETFLTVCRTMNYTRAARELHISQPAVSQQIKYLEGYYHAVLIRHEGKKLFLTDAGALLQKSLTMLHNNELYLQEQLRLLADRRLTLRFGASRTVGEFMIAAPLAQFLLRRPGADVTVRVDNTRRLLELLDLGEIDFAILEGDYPAELYAHRPYRTEAFIPIYGAKYAFRKKPATLAELTGERLLLREAGSGTRSILERALTERGIALRDFAGVTVVENMNAIKEMVLAGCGVTFLYEGAVRPELDSGALRRLSLSDCDLHHEISLVWKKDNLFQTSFAPLFEELLGVAPSQVAGGR